MKLRSCVTVMSAVLVLASCTGGNVSSSSGNATAAPVRAQDALTKAAVMTAVIATSADAINNVNAEVSDGKVQLKGVARNPREAQRYAEAAKHAPGVKSVTASFRYDPNLRGAGETLADAALTAKVVTALSAQTGVNATRVKATARDGVVTLSGSAPSMAVKTTMLDAARSVSGVRAVIDRIEVKP